MVYKYSVLMSVYEKEKPEYLEQSILSILQQTIKTDDFVLVCDGPLTENLEKVLKRYRDHLHIFRLNHNKGLGTALNAGLTECKNELVARMDSDDISLPDRCEKQLKAFEKAPQTSILSGTVLEFNDTESEKILGRREVPGSNNEIKKYLRRRNPFNHPAVMFRRDDVIKSGGYRDKFPLFEDYDLWVRMLKRGYQGANLKDPLVKMRTTPGTYERRGGFEYARVMLDFHRYIRKMGMSTWVDFLCADLPHAIVCIIPGKLRKKIYHLIRT
ncbi:MAG: glycosyltransferase [Eubacterium sp.]|nr:glycosyltransferase [Eubacterium sp.]